MNKTPNGLSKVYRSLWFGLILFAILAAIFGLVLLYSPNDLLLQRTWAFAGLCGLVGTIIHYLANRKK